MAEINLFSLAPPNTMGDAYTNLVVNLQGVPLGQTPSGQQVARMLGYSDKDSIGPVLNEIIQMASMLNLGITITGSIDHEINVYLNTIDPAKPGLPPIKSLLIILERNLQAGKLGNVQIHQKSNTEVEIQTKAEDDIDVKTHEKKTKESKEKDIDVKTHEKKTKGPRVYDNPAREYDEFHPLDNTVLVQDEKIRQEISDDTKDSIEIGRQINLNADFTTPTITIGKGVGGNPWLTGNAYVVFLLVFMELQRVLMQSKVVQGNIELKSMELTFQLAQETADMIMKIAEMNRMMHITQAAMAAVSITFSTVSLVAGIGGAKMGWKGAVEFSQMASSMGSGLDKSITSAIQASQDIPIAMKEGAKEMLQAIRTLIQRQMEKSGEAFKNQEEQISQLLQALDKIRDGLQQAIAGSLRK